ncbi:hypothetical protein [Microbispora sp. NBRC 16548]|nr:hypothetical protein [Microbispora sp. NBRC 16548]
MCFSSLTALPLPRRLRSPVFLVVVVFIGAGVLARPYAYTSSTDAARC